MAANALQGKVALVTGASRGIGAETARALAASGAAVALLARNGDRAAAVGREIAADGGRAEAFACDVADYAAVVAAVTVVGQRLGPCDILVNNAGVIEPIAMLAESDPAAWSRSIAINLIGAYNAVRALLPGMLKRGGGRIVNVSSGAAHRPLEGWSAYCAGKAGLAMVTNAIQLETAARGIRVFGFSPGTIDTDMQATIRVSGINPVSQIPRGNLTPVADAVRGLVYLCTLAADDLAGQEVSLRDDTFRRRIGLG